MTAAAILEPGQIEPPAGEIPFIRLPERNSIFRERAARLRTLAQNHSMADFLAFMAKLGEAQQQALVNFPDVPLPDGAHLMACRQHGMPPLAAQNWPRDPAWRLALRQILADVRDSATPSTQAAIGRLMQSDSTALEKQADALLAGQFAALDLAAAPFVAAALQVYWLHMTSGLGEKAFGRNDMPNLCPVCASPPVASIVKIGGEHGLRYVHCSLCSSEWHMVRVKCSNCETTKGLAYYNIENTPGSVKAEACSECGSYLKIMYMDKDPFVDPVADDLATLTLDLLMAEAGIMRSGPNFLLIPSEESLA